MNTTVDALAPLHAHMRTWRRDIHAHPEVGSQESRTAALVADRLEALGLEVTRGVSKTGVVGTLSAGSGKRSIGLRADMDALPIHEGNTFVHRSTRSGVMHACGHDGHTAMLLGAAFHLARTKRFDGTVHFIFQPAEEGLGRAKAMIDDGLFRRFPCDTVFGMHNRPSLPVGHFAAKAGPMMAGGAFFDIHVTGKGAHGARPETGVDAALAAAQIAVALQSIVARNVPPVETAVLSVTQIHAGDAYNVIPQTARLAGTVRAFSREVMLLVEASMRRVAAGTAEALGAKANSFVTNEIDVKNHVVQTKIDNDLKLIEVDITVEKYDDSLQEQLQNKLKNYGLNNSKIKIYQTIEAGKSNQKEFDKLNTEIELLKTEIKKMKTQ